MCMTKLYNMCSGCSKMWSSQLTLRALSQFYRASPSAEVIIKKVFFTHLNDQIIRQMVDLFVVILLQLHEVFLYGTIPLILCLPPAEWRPYSHDTKTERDLGGDRLGFGYARESLCIPPS